jgi:hypothetical protein
MFHSEMLSASPHHIPSRKWQCQQQLRNDGIVVEENKNY